MATNNDVWEYVILPKEQYTALQEEVEHLREVLDMIAKMPKTLPLALSVCQSMAKAALKPAAS
jgi:predicted RecB family endonuclease